MYRPTPHVLVLTCPLPSLISYHVDLNMDTVVTAVRNLFGFVTGVKPEFRVHGGTQAENLALQNIQVCPSTIPSPIAPSVLSSTRSLTFSTLTTGSSEDGARVHVRPAAAVRSRPKRRAARPRKRKRR